VHDIFVTPTTRRRGRFAALAAAAGTALATAVIVTAGSSSAEAVPPEAFSGFHNAAIISGTTTYTANLNVPAGSYVISAKLSAFAGNNTSTTSYVEECQLTAGTNFDRSFTRLAGSSAEQTLSMQVVHVFGSAGTVSLTCNGTSSTASTLLEFVKITAVKVNSISDVPV
jgi:hypothetical protein